MKKYQTFYPRLAALILDSILLLPLTIFDDWIKAAAVSPAIHYILIGIVSFAGTFYFTLMHGLYGQTVGKMLMKIKVMDVSESPLKFYQALLRDLPQILFVIGSFIFASPDLSGETVEPSVYFSNPFFMATSLWGIADIITFFTNEKRRALHDFIAGSVVVKIETDNRL